MNIRKNIILFFINIFSFFFFSAGVYADDTLMLKAYESKTRALAVSMNGKVQKESYFKLAPDPVDAGATYRLLLFAGIGKLIEEGKLKSIEEPVFKYLPSWNQSLKKEVLISHLLDGTTGLLGDPDDPDETKPQNAYRFAEAAILTGAPGLQYQPSVKELWLLSLLIREVSGMETEKYLSEKILQPLEVKEYRFIKDAIGQVTGIEVVAGQWIHLAELFLLEGKYRDKAMLNPDFCKGLFSFPGSAFTDQKAFMTLHDTSYVFIDDAFIEELSISGLSKEVIEGFKKIKGRYMGVQVPVSAWEKAFGADFELVLNSQVYPLWPRPYKRYQSGKVRGVLIMGDRGEQVFIDKKSGKCAVRLPYPGNGRVPVKNLWTDFCNDVIKH
jgi:hypothetical protein